MTLRSMARVARGLSLRTLEGAPVCWERTLVRGWPVCAWPGSNEKQTSPRRGAPPTPGQRVPPELRGFCPRKAFPCLCVAGLSRSPSVQSSAAPCALRMNSPAWKEMKTQSAVVYLLTHFRELPFHRKVELG